MIGNSNDETNFPYKILSTGTQFSKIRKTFANGLSANIKFSKTQLFKMIQSGGFNILDLMNPAQVVYKIGNKAKDLSNNMSLDDVIKTSDISRNYFPDFQGILGTGITLTNDEIKDIKVIKSLENRRILLK